LQQIQEIYAATHWFGLESALPIHDS
jgi:hypothetical protein